MGISRRKMQSKLWTAPDQLTLTDHQTELAGRLDPDEDIQIRGPIGSGKTFTVRHQLRDRGISFEYYTVGELLAKSDMIKSNRGYADADTVVVDNFDVAPQERQLLDEIYEIIEKEFESFDRSVWLILPEGWKHQWFETLLWGYRTEVIQNTNITNIHISRIVENLRDITSESLSNDPTPTREALNTTGYHAAIRAICYQL